MKTETIVGLFVIGAIGIFFYLSFSIGSLRLDKDRYDFYKVFFNDTGGLEVKDAVKIAGVDVGWVEDIQLSGKDGKAIVTFRVRKENKLAKNAYAMAQQEGLIGTKYLEIDPGDSSHGILPPGSALGQPSRAPTTVGELLTKFSDIASNINDVVVSFKKVTASREGESQMKEALEGLALASTRIANFSGVLERTLDRNERNLNTMMRDMTQVTKSLKQHLPGTMDGIDRASNRLADETLPEFSRDFHNISDDVHGVSGEVEGVFEKVNSGKGTIGKLINEDQTYNDLKKSLEGFREYAGKMRALDVWVDMHSENYIRDFDTSKGYFSLKLRPTQDYYYIVQLIATGKKGPIERKEIHYRRFDRNHNELTAPNDSDAYTYPDQLSIQEQTRYGMYFGFQFAKRFDRLALRIGLFENTFGAGLDYHIPLRYGSVNWITTFEAFDFQGINRLDDPRPHIKWLNRLFFGRNMYTTFGFDDMMSRRSATPFFGGGIRFGDKDLKLLLPQVSGAAQLKKV